MLKIQVRENESIDRAIKRYRNKFRKTRVLQELRRRQQYTKKSTLRKEQKRRAEYRNQYLLSVED